MKCGVRFPIIEPGDVVKISEGYALSQPPKFLTCELEADHGGRHYDAIAGWWQFVPFTAAELLGDHVNCRCELATIETGVQLPPWWVADRCDEVFGPTAPELFFPVLR